MKAERKNQGKLEWSLVDFPSLEPMVKGLMYGKEEYSRDNWKKGLPVVEQVDSLFRHATAFARSEDIDPESQVEHLGLLMCNAMFLIWTLKNRPELDNRTSQKNN